MKKCSLFSLALVMLFLAAAILPLMPASAAPDPNAPANLVVTMNAVTGMIELDWSVASPLYVTCTVMRKESTSAAWEDIATNSATSYEDDATVLYPGSTYEYQVKNSTGTSSTVSVVRVPLVCTSPGDVQGEALGTDSIKVTWTNTNTFPAHTDVIYTRQGMSDDEEEIVAPGITEVTLTGLQEDTTYDISLIAYTDYEVSDPPVTISVATLKSAPATAPSAPIELTAEAMHPDEIMLNWTDTSDNETGFKIYRQEGINGSMELIETLGANATTHPDAPLTPGTTYYYQVFAYNSAGDAPSNIASATTPLETTATTVMKFYIGNTQYLVNGQAALLDSPPIAVENRTMLPIRYVVTPLGGTAEWDPIGKKATITCNGHVIMLWLNNNTASVDGLSKQIDETNAAVMPLTANNRILMPLRFVGENLDCGVEWNQGTSEAVITYPDTE